MHVPIVKHTITIFERLHNQIPPLVPEEVRNNFLIEITNAHANEAISLHELEEAMFPHIREIWPYVQAFGEIVESHDQRLGEKLLIQKASPQFKKKYSLFSKLGGAYTDLYTGGTAEHFSPPERQELGELLVEVKRDIRQHAMQAVLTHDRKTYEEKVEYYGRMIEEINGAIGALKKFAGEHALVPGNFKEDVESKVKAIQQSVSFLGPSIDMEEIRRAREYYEGKREEKRKLWGI